MQSNYWQQFAEQLQDKHLYPQQTELDVSDKVMIFSQTRVFYHK